MEKKPMARFEMKPKGLVVHGEPTLDQWMQFGKTLEGVGWSFPWWIGDWYMHGTRAYREASSQALSIANAAGLSPGRVENCGYTAAAFEFPRRRGGLSFRHHAEVASLPIAEADRLLDLAEEKELSVRDLVLEVRKGQIAPLPGDKYRILYVDPPWEYGNAQHSREEQATTLATHYPSLSTDELCAMPVGGLALDDAVLFLWATSPKLEEALRLITAWGFTYKTSMVWDKVHHNVGYYVSVRHELLLIATRGSCTPDVPELVDSVVAIERTEHSEKPEYFRELIDRLYTMGKRIELFARAHAEGWEAYGNDARLVAR